MKTSFEEQLDRTSFENQFTRKPCFFIPFQENLYMVLISSIENPVVEIEYNNLLQKILLQKLVTEI